MIPGARLILLGRQGAGKGTQCVRLSRHYVVPHISTGDMLRAAVREGTELGRMAKQVMDDGGLVGDEIMVGIVEARLNRDDARTRGYILDGFPRTVGQAVALDRITQERPLDVVLDLDVPRELVLERISARRVCRDCGTNYVATKTEKSPWICEVCGGDVMQRDDDTPDAINRRLDLYEEQTSPLIQYYGDAARLAVINGVGTPDEIFGRLVVAVEDARRPSVM
jgi:adenylate kinase